MTITVNKRKVEFREAETIGGLMKRMRYNFPLVIVKVDGELVPRSEYSERFIRNGSRIDIIHLTSGG